MAAGRRALGSAFELGKDEVLAELTPKGGWASHSLLMAGLVATAVPGPAHPHGAATGSEPAAAWDARAAQVLYDVGRLAILLTVYDIWGVAGEPGAARTRPS